MIPTGEYILNESWLKFEKIGAAKLDTGFQFIGDGKIATTQLYSEELDTTINLWQETFKSKFEYLQVFIPPGRKSIAIEPMTCNTDAFNNGDGLLKIEPGKVFIGSFGVYLS